MGRDSLEIFSGGQQQLQHVFRLRILEVECMCYNSR